MTYDDFLVKYALLMRLFQCIEFDIKWTYSAMRVGDMLKNRREVDKMTLGTVVKLLNKLDNSDSKPHLTESDYQLLSDITRIRNYWAHTCFTDFVYSSSNLQEDLNKTSRRLENDYNRVNKLAESIEKFRISIVNNRN